MSVNTGDTPDFETLNSSQFKFASVFEATAQANLISTANPIRLWQAFITGTFGTTSAYTTTTGNDQNLSLEDPGGDLYLALQFRLAAANQGQNGSISIPLYGIPVQNQGGLYTVQLVFGTPITNTVLRGTAGIVYSQP